MSQSSARIPQHFDLESFYSCSAEVDTDEYTLQVNKYLAAPLVVDYIAPRETPLRMEVFRGSIDVSDERLRNTDAVIAIEVIEHLPPDVLENVPFNVFGFIQPKIAMFTTPNSDFNVLFPQLKDGGFRHYDHRFEWSRQQFEDWALNICERFPNYLVSIFGVGGAPPDSPDVGPVSQIALFVRKDMLDMPLVSEIKKSEAYRFQNFEYEEIYSVDLPVRHDERTHDQKVFDEALVAITRYRNNELYYNMERDIYQIPFQLVLNWVGDLTESAHDLRRVLLDNAYTFEDEYIIVPEDDPYGYNSDEDLDIYEEEESNSSNWSDRERLHEEERREEVEQEEEELWD